MWEFILKCLDFRTKLAEFLSARHNDDGGFTMHEGGEVDIRGAYCAASVARLTNIFTEDLFKNTAEWIVGLVTL